MIFYKKILHCVQDDSYINKRNCHSEQSEESMEMDMGSIMANIIIIVILLAAVTGACVYIYKEKKKGRHCIGCPMAASCPKRNMAGMADTCGTRENTGRKAEQRK